MGLIDSINKHNTQQGVDAILNLLDAGDRSELLEALRDSKKVGATAISRALRDHGYEASEASVRRWRERNLTVTGL